MWVLLWPLVINGYFKMEVLIEQIAIYGTVALLCGVTIYLYLKKQKQTSQVTEKKIAKAKEEGLFEPVSLHPYIDLATCIGSAACITACPEKDILGVVDGVATVINASNCVGHGACFHACPVEAISLRIGTESRGVELPHVNQNFESNFEGIFIAGELGGMGLIKNSVEQGQQAVENIAKKFEGSKDGAYDLIIVGAGPAGISATLTAKKLGLSTLTLEQDTLGGTVYSFPRSKIVMTAPMDLSLYGKVKLFDTSKDELLHIWNEALGKNNLSVQEKTKVDAIVPLEDGLFKVKTNSGAEYFSQYVLLAIGRRGTPRKLGVPGEDHPKVWYRLLEPERIEGKDIVVVGGGDSAIEAALLLADQNKVTLSYRKDKFSRLKPKNKEKIEKAINSNAINMMYNTNLASIGKDHVVITNGKEGKGVTIPNDQVYIFAGGELPSAFLKNAGVEISKRFGYIVKKHK